MAVTLLFMAALAPWAAASLSSSSPACLPPRVSAMSEAQFTKFYGSLGAWIVELSSFEKFAAAATAKNMKEEDTDNLRVISFSPGDMAHDVLGIERIVMWDASSSSDFENNHGGEVPPLDGPALLAKTDAGGTKEMVNFVRGVPDGLFVELSTGANSTSFTTIGRYVGGKRAAHPIWRVRPDLVEHRYSETESLLVSHRSHLCPPAVADAKKDTLQEVEVDGFEINPGELAKARFKKVNKKRRIDVGAEMSIVRHLGLDKDEMFDFFNVARVKFALACEKKRKILKSRGQSMFANETLFHEEKRSVGWNIDFSRDDGGDLNCPGILEVAWPPSGSVRGDMLFAFPGSGSKWITIMVELATGIATEWANHYPMLDDIALDNHILFRMHHVYHGELHNGSSDASAADRSKATVLKRSMRIVDNGGRAALLVRNPYEAVISWWNHNLAGSPFGGVADHRHLEATLRSPEFCAFATAEIAVWREMLLDWIVLGDDVVLVHYEAALEDRMSELRRLLEFMGAPEVAWRMECLEKYNPDVFNRRRPQSGLTSSPYCTEAASAAIEAIATVDAAARTRGLGSLPTHLYNLTFWDSTNGQK